WGSESVEGRDCRGSQKAEISFQSLLCCRVSHSLFGLEIRRYAPRGNAAREYGHYRPMGCRAARGLWRLPRREKTSSPTLSLDENRYVYLFRGLTPPHARDCLRLPLLSFRREKCGTG